MSECKKGFPLNHPVVRMWRLRQLETMRRMVAETTLKVIQDVIKGPVKTGKCLCQKVAVFQSMNGVEAEGRSS